MMSSASWWRGKFGRAGAGASKIQGRRSCAHEEHSPRNPHPAATLRARGHVGVIERDHGCQVFPDSAATESGENPQWLYTVVFDGAELWGPDADPTVRVSIDAFEPYLEAA